jgi:DNA-binding beta-propeller fold protein YncE
MVVIQAESGKVLDTLAIGARSDAAAFDPETKLAFSSNGDGTVTVVGKSSSDHYKVLQNVPTTPMGRTMALAPTTHKLYLAAAKTVGKDLSGVNAPHPRPNIKPDSFMILTIAPKAP